MKLNEFQKAVVDRVGHSTDEMSEVEASTMAREAGELLAKAAEMADMCGYTLNEIGNQWLQGSI